MSSPETTPQMPDALIIVNELSKWFGLRPALRGVTFSVPRQARVALLGPNGSGKTTLLRVLAALSTPTQGRVTIGGWSLPREAGAVRAQIGVVSHQTLLYDDLTAEENLRFYGQVYGLREGLAERIKAALDQVGLSKRTGDFVRTFSRGMAQRLALARALIHDPAVLLLDEPYTGLDTAGMALLDRLLEQWMAAGKTAIISLHEIERAARLCERALILNGGRLVQDAPTDSHLPARYAEVTAG